MRRLISLVLAVAALSACTSHPDAATGPAKPALVRPDGSVSGTFDGTTLTGPAGAVVGTATARPASDKVDQVDGIAVESTGAGVDVELAAGSRVDKPLTVTFPAVAPAPGLVPVVAHRTDAGTWELKAVTGWDGKTAVLTTSQFSPNILAWLNPAQIADKVKAYLTERLTGRRPAPACPSGVHTWAELHDDEDLVHACLTNADLPGGAEQVVLRLSPNRGATVQVDLPAGPGTVTVDNQTVAFRGGVARLLRVDPNRTVFLGPEDNMTVTWTRPATDANPVVGVTASPRAMALTIFDSGLSYSGLTLNTAREAGLVVAAGCAKQLGHDLLRSASGVMDTLVCLGQGAVGNLLDPATALGAARSFLGPGADELELAQQVTKLTALGTGLLAAGAFVRVLAVLAPVRGVVLAVFGTVSDQVQTVVLRGGGTTVGVQLRAAAKAPPPAAPATLAVLLSAPVPALRGNKAGRMVNGELPGIPGSVSLGRTDPAPVFGDLTGDGVPDAVAVINATSGAGGNDQYVMVYSNGKLLGTVDPAGLSHGVHAYVGALTVTSGQVQVDWGSDPGDGSDKIFYRVVLRWNGRSLVQSGLAAAD